MIGLVITLSVHIGRREWQNPFGHIKLYKVWLFISSFGYMFKKFCIKLWVFRCFKELMIVWIYHFLINFVTKRAFFEQLMSACLCHIVCYHLLSIYKKIPRIQSFLREGRKAVGRYLIQTESVYKETTKFSYGTCS